MKKHCREVIETELTVKHFSELTTDELFEIYKLRVGVFVVEQNCAYPEVDDFDRLAYHIWLSDGGKIAAYARVLPPKTVFETCSIGRVIAVKRRKGYGTQTVEAAVNTAREKFAADKITVEAQTYARGLYEKLGFVQASDEFLEDGIPHVKMELQL